MRRPSCAGPPASAAARCHVPVRAFEKRPMRRSEGTPHSLSANSSTTDQAEAGKACAEQCERGRLGHHM